MPEPLLGLAMMLIDGGLAVPFTGNLGDVSCWKAAAHETIEARIEGADRIPLLGKLIPCVSVGVHSLWVIVYKTEITLECLDHVSAESLHVVDRYICALGEGGGVKGQEVGCADALFLEGGKEVSIWRCGKGGENGREVGHGGIWKSYGRERGFRWTLWSSPPPGVMCYRD